MARRKRAAGGRVYKINAPGHPVMEDATKTKSDGFATGGTIAARKAGGAVPALKRGGKVEGEAAEERLDKRARGGIVGRRAGGSVRGLKSAGGSPFSSARNTTPASGNGGKEGERAPSVE